jgi:hypothetical protein
MGYVQAAYGTTLAPATVLFLTSYVPRGGCARLSPCCNAIRAAAPLVVPLPHFARGGRIEHYFSECRLPREDTRRLEKSRFLFS